MNGLKINFFLLILIIIPMQFIAAGDKGDESSFKIGFIERLRVVAWDDAIDLDEVIDNKFLFTRHRTSVSFDWKPLNELQIFCKLTNEFRVYFQPEDREFALHEMFFDQLFVRWKRPADLPITFTIGRQNMRFGEGFLVMDGHPLDGSRSIYFNAARIDIDFKPDYTLTLFYTYQPIIDNILPVINEQPQSLVEQPEEGIGVYFKGKIGDIDLHLYYIKKNIYLDEGNPIADESGIDTLGTRIVLPLAEVFDITFEGALQSGWMAERDRAAIGGYFHLDYRTGKSIPLLSTITIGGIYLSGDDQTTDEYEAWDPLFSRWPKWSESYIYTLIKESRVAYWSNLTSLYTTLKFKIIEDADLIMSYHHLGAAQADLREISFPGGNGTVRGDLLISKLIVKITDYLTGHILWEGFKPGDFYSDDFNGYNWFRFELLLKI